MARARLRPGARVIRTLSRSAACTRRTRRSCDGLARGAGRRDRKHVEARGRRRAPRPATLRRTALPTRRWPRHLRLSRLGSVLRKTPCVRRRQCHRVRVAPCAARALAAAVLRASAAALPLRSAASVSSMAARLRWPGTSSRSSAPPAAARRRSPLSLLPSAPHSSPTTCSRSRRPMPVSWRIPGRPA